jgi:toxin YoeB
MGYHLDFSTQANDDIDFYKKSGNKAILKKILILLNELTEHPFVGTGKPESLKYEFSGYWSRRITQEHRLIYEVDGDRVLILSAKGHY